MADSKKGLVPRTQPQGNLSKNPLFAPPTEDELRGAETIDFGQGENPLFAPPTKEELSADYFDAADVPTGQVSGELGSADRAKLSFASNENEKINYLLKKYPGAMIGRTVGGEGESKGDLVIQIPGEKGFKYIDSPALTGADVADFAGDIPEIAGGLIGGALSAPTGPGAVKGAMIGGGLGTVAKKAIGRQILDVDTPVNLSDVKDVVLSTGLSGAGAAAPMLLRPAGQAIAKGAKATGGLIKSIPGKVSGIVRGSADDAASKIAQSADDIAAAAPLEKAQKYLDPSEYAEETAKRVAAAKTIGAEATPGILSSDPAIRAEESMFLQTPSVVGGWLKKKAAAFSSKMSEAVDDLGSTQITSDKALAAERVREGVMRKITGKADPFNAAYDEIRKGTKEISVDPKLIQRTSNFMNKYAEQSFAGNPQAKAIVSQVQKELAGAKTAEDIMKIRTMLGDMVQKSARATTIYDMAPIYRSLTSVRNKSVMSAAAQLEKEGATGAGLIAQKFVKQIKKTDRGYAKHLDELHEFARQARLPGINEKSSANEVMEAIQRVDDDKLFNAMFGTRDIKVQKYMMKQFPEAFDVARGVKLADILNNSMVKGEGGSRVVSVSKFIQNVKKVAETPTERALLFGPKTASGKNPEEIFQAIQVLSDAVPSKAGPSGTAQALNLISEMSDAASIPLPTGLGWLSSLAPLKKQFSLYRSSGRLMRADEAMKKTAQQFSTLGAGGVEKYAGGFGRPSADPKSFGLLSRSVRGAGAGLLGAQAQGLLKQKESGR